VTSVILAVYSDCSATGHCGPMYISPMASRSRRFYSLFYQWSLLSSPQACLTTTSPRRLLSISTSRLAKETSQRQRGPHISTHGVRREQSAGRAVDPFDPTIVVGYDNPAQEAAHRKPGNLFRSLHSDVGGIGMARHQAREAQARKPAEREEAAAKGDAAFFRRKEVDNDKAAPTPTFRKHGAEPGAKGREADVSFTWQRVARESRELRDRPRTTRPPQLETEPEAWEKAEAQSSAEKPFDSLEPWAEVVRYNASAGVMLQMAVPMGSWSRLRRRQGNVENMAKRYGASVEIGQKSTKTDSDGNPTELRSLLISGLHHEVRAVRKVLRDFEEYEAESSETRAKKEAGYEPVLKNQSPVVGYGARESRDLNEWECVLRKRSPGGILTAEIAAPAELWNLMVNSTLNVGEVGKSQNAKINFKSIPGSSATVSVVVEGQADRIHRILRKFKSARKQAEQGEHGQPDVSSIAEANPEQTSLPDRPTAIANDDSNTVTNLPSSTDDQSQQLSTEPTIHVGDGSYTPKPLDSRPITSLNVWECVLREKPGGGEDGICTAEMLVPAEEWKKVTTDPHFQYLRDFKCWAQTIISDEVTAVVESTGRPAAVVNLRAKFFTLSKLVRKIRKHFVYRDRKGRSPYLQLDGAIMPYNAYKVQYMDLWECVIRERTKDGNFTVQIVAPSQQWSDIVRNSNVLRKDGLERHFHVQVSTQPVTGRDGTISIVVKGRTENVIRLIDVVRSEWMRAQRAEAAVSEDTAGDGAVVAAQSVGRESPQHEQRSVPTDSGPDQPEKQVLQPYVRLDGPVVPYSERALRDLGEWECVLRERSSDEHGELTVQVAAPLAQWNAMVESSRTMSNLERFGVSFSAGKAIGLEGVLSIVVRGTHNNVAWLLSHIKRVRGRLENPGSGRPGSTGAALEHEDPPHVVERRAQDMKTALRVLTHSVVLITSKHPGLDESPGAATMKSRALAISSGVTVSSFNSVTLHPRPIISFNLRVPSRTWDAIKASQRFCVHVLTATPDGAAIAHAFTQPYERAEEPFERLTRAGYTVNSRVHGGTMSASPPTLGRKGVAALLQAKVLGGKEVVIGDHVIVVAEVTSVFLREAGEGEKAELGLAYARRGYRGHGGEIQPAELVHGVGAEAEEPGVAVEDEGVEDEFGKPEEDERDVYVSAPPQEAPGGHEVPSNEVNTAHEAAGEHDTPAAVEANTAHDGYYVSGGETEHRSMDAGAEEPRTDDSAKAFPVDFQDADADVVEAPETYAARDAAESSEFDTEAYFEEMARAPADAQEQPVSADLGQAAEPLREGREAPESSELGQASGTGENPNSEAADTADSDSVPRIPRQETAPPQRAVRGPRPGAWGLGPPPRSSFSTLAFQRPRHYSSVSGNSGVPTEWETYVTDPSLLTTTVADFLGESVDTPVVARTRMRGMMRSKNEAEKASLALERALAAGTLTADESRRLEHVVLKNERRVARKLAQSSALDLRNMLDTGRVLDNQRTQWLESSVEKGLAILLEEAKRLREALDQQWIAVETFNEVKGKLEKEHMVLNTEVMRLRQMVDEEDG